MAFAVGDKIRSVKWYETKNIGPGNGFVVTAVHDGYNTLYDLERLGREGVPDRRTYHRCGGSYFELVEPTIASPVLTPAKPLTEMTVEELIEQLEKERQATVRLAYDVMNKATRQYGFCDEGKRTVEKFVRELGLEKYVTKKKVLTVEVEVPGDATEAVIRELAAQKLPEAVVRDAR